MAAAGIAFGIAGLSFPEPSPAQSPDTVRWQTFESGGGRFKVAFPGAPVMKQGRLRTEIGEIASVRHTADSADATYDVTYNDYPESGVARLTAAKLLDTARDGLVYQAKGTLASEKTFMLGTRTGREYDISGEGGMRYRIRLLLVNNRLYQLSAIARLPAAADDRKFFDSFQLTKESP